jgi:excisionase family DNA binding protein
VDTSTLAKPLLGTHDVARLLNVTPNTARRLMLHGDIPAARRIGGLWRVRAADIDAMFVSGRDARLDRGEKDQDE